MKKFKKDKRIKSSIFSVPRFIGTFLLVAFVVTSSFLLFFNTRNIKMSLPQQDIEASALSTFFNIVFLCVTLSVFDGVRRRIQTGVPVERILEATHKITNGDFSVKIKPVNRKKYYNEFDVIIEDFNKMAQELSSIETLKTDFISYVSHELKTPLSVIQNYSTILMSDTLDEEERREYVCKINKASENLSELITSILRLNKLENQQIFFNKERFNLSEQLCECMLGFEGVWEEKQIEIVTRFDETIEIYEDRELLEIVWSDLLSNAFKFTPEKGTVCVDIFRHGEKVCVKISDTGCGMTQETKKHIFEKFYQGDKSHSTKGNGLGLSIVKRIVDIINAGITVESKEGEGSCFTVEIPFKIQ